MDHKEKLLSCCERQVGEYLYYCFCCFLIEKTHKESIQIRGITTYVDILSLSFFCHVYFVRTYVGQLSAGVNLMKLGFSPKTNKIRIEKKTSKHITIIKMLVIVITR